MRLIYILFLLFLISFSTPKIHSKNELHRRRHKSTTKTRALSDIFTLLANTFTQPKNYWYFMLGVLSEFVPEVTQWYDRLAALADAFIVCFSNFSPTESAEAAGISFADYETQMRTRELKKAKCIETKERVTGAFQKVQMLQGKFAAAGNTKELERMERLKKIIEKKVGYNLDERATYWLNVNCDDFNPQTEGFTDFAKTAYGFYRAVVDAGNCIATQLQPLAMSEAKAFLLKYFKGIDFISSLIDNTLGLIANIFTLGLWGGAKATYNAILLGQKIWIFFKNPEVETARRIGAIIGNAFLVVKSLFLGRKKRKFFKRK